MEVSFPQDRLDMFHMASCSEQIMCNYFHDLRKIIILRWMASFGLKVIILINTSVIINHLLPNTIQQFLRGVIRSLYNRNTR